MQVIKRIDEARSAISAARQRGHSVGLVPTMGALHKGHLSLMKTTRKRDDFVVISIFVNPTQFGPGEDYKKYPHQLQRDSEIAQSIGVDLIFVPSPQEIYPNEFCTYVAVERLTEGLCGRYRPGHFRAVTTVVAKLLNIIQPDRAYFGEKDYQQLVVIRRMIADLNMPVEVVGLPTVREPDGLATSSRNQHLSSEERRTAPCLYQALVAGAELIKRGAIGAEAEQAIKEVLVKQPLFEVQYVEAVHPDTLEPTPQAGPPMVIAAAAYLGKTRLIDNIRVEEGSNDA